MWTLITCGVGIVAVLYSVYMIMTNPELLQQIQEGAIGSLYGF